MRPKVLIADDHRLIADALARLLTPTYEVVGIVTDGQALLDVAPVVGPDLILLDLAVPGMNSLEAARRLRSTLPEIKLIILTATADPVLAAETLRVGAFGYLLKSAAARDLFAAIDKVLQGGVYLGVTSPDGSSSRPAPRPAATPRLTSRQQEVLRLLSSGHSMKMAAKALKISPRTVAFHKYAMMQRHGLNNTAALMHFGALLDALSIPEEFIEPASTGQAEASLPQA